MTSKKGEDIRKKYKRISRRTSYKDFYKTIKDLVDEKGKDNLQFKPRIRGKNQKEKINIRYEDAKRYIPSNVPYSQTGEFILKALEYDHRHLERQRDDAR